MTGGPGKEDQQSIFIKSHAHIFPILIFFPNLLFLNLHFPQLTNLQESSKNSATNIQHFSEAHPCTGCLQSGTLMFAASGTFGTLGALSPSSFPSNVPALQNLPEFSLSTTYILTESHGDFFKYIISHARSGEGATLPPVHLVLK